MGLSYSKASDLSHLSASNNGGVGLVASYNMIASPGNVLVDTSGEGNNGTINNFIVPFKDGLSYTGTVDQQSGDAPILLTDLDLSADTLTVVCRVRMTVAMQSVFIVNKYSAGPDAGYIVSISSTGHISFYCSNQVQSAIGLITLNNWYNIVCTYDDGDVNIYLNGVLVKSQSGLTYIQNNTLVNLFGTFGGGSAGNVDIEDLQFYSVVKDLQFAKDYHNQFASRINQRLKIESGVGSTI